MNVRVKNIGVEPPIEAYLPDIAHLGIWPSALGGNSVSIWPNMEGGITIHLWQAFVVTGQGDGAPGYAFPVLKGAE
jgi:hypothetical protein